jgi:hypothetical protein
VHCAAICDSALMQCQTVAQPALVGDKWQHDGATRCCHRCRTRTIVACSSADVIVADDAHDDAAHTAGAGRQARHDRVDDDHHRAQRARIADSAAVSQRC